MGKGRLEAFSDGVIAIIITIMVLEMKVPHGDSLESLLPLAPGLSELRAELRLRRHLLEQPSPHAARVHEDLRRDAVGKPASALLAFAVSRSPPAGWARTTLPRCRPRSTAWSC